ncbi:MAG: FecR domain-containing protein [Marinifilaceae bacterium]|nr:FecR domain-containing protein [Marinifilaceae bacterium]
METKTPFTESELLDFFNGHLSEAEEKEILAWKDACKENRKLFETIREEQLMLKETVRARLISLDYNAIREQVEKHHSRKIRLIRYWSAAAAIVLLVGSSLLFWPAKKIETPSMTISTIKAPSRSAILELATGEQHYLESGNIQLKEENGAQIAISNGKQIYNTQQTSQPEEPTETVSYNRLSVPRGTGVYRITLSDGTEIWLNSDSRLEYPGQFAADERRVRVTGEAYFKVHRDTNRPFIVETSRQSVTVLGTEFNVSAYPSEPESTTLASGSVSVSPQAGTPTTLVPGEQAVLDSITHTLSVHKVNVNDVISWKNGIISIENLSLSEILKIVSRAYNVDFVSAIPPSEDIVLRGSVSSEESLEVFLSVLSKIADINFKMRTDGKIEVQKIK